MSAPSAQILVIRGGAIGDFIVTLPVLAALRNQFPAARLELVAYDRVAGLAVGSGLVDGWRPIESRGLASFFGKNGVVEPEWQDYFAGFPIIISHLFDPDELFQNNVRKRFDGQFIQSIHRPDETLPIHATEQLLKPLERLAIFDADPVPRLTFDKVGRRLPPSRPDDIITTNRPTRPPDQASESPELLAETEHPLRRLGGSHRPTIAIHPGSGSESKNWPVEHWCELLARLVAEREDDILVIAGEADHARLAALQSVVPESRRRVLFQRPLVEVAEALNHCRFFIGHDSGISHLAAAVGLTGAVFWGPTNQTVWQPRSEQFHVIEAQGQTGARPASEAFQVLKRLGV